MQGSMELCNDKGGRRQMLHVRYEVSLFRQDMHDDMDD